MNLKEACDKAKEYYSKEWGCSDLSEIKDLGDKWLFFPTDETKAFGNFHITVDKATGEVEPFILPLKENFDRLKKAVVVQKPNE